jgi:hypothetical protein
MDKKKRSLWTPEDDKELKKLLIVRGFGIDNISSALKRSAKAVRRRCERLNISSSSTYVKKKKKRK